MGCSLSVLKLLSTMCVALQGWERHITRRCFSILFRSCYGSMQSFYALSRLLFSTITISYMKFTQVFNADRAGKSLILHHFVLTSWKL